MSTPPKQHELPPTVNDRYDRAKLKREESVLSILTSTSKKKVVVAGPGTGKTYLFKMLLKGKQRTLTLTFINALVEDLSLDLYGISEVKTLHSFATDLLRKVQKKKKINIFPRLSEIIEEDIKLLTGQEVDFDKIFHDFDGSNLFLDFYQRRKHFYDDFYGYSDVVFAAVKALEKRPDWIPKYELILVDEYQDFNLLEVTLIDQLGRQNPVVLAGDDDQALYDFKRADPKHIRSRHNGNLSEYQAFSLPMCFRCTRIIVEAANDIVKSAIANNLLQNRIAKPYEYYDDQLKDEISNRFPTLTYTQLYASQFGWFIETNLDEIARAILGNFSVLVISPTRVQARDVTTALREKGFKSVEFIDKKEKKLNLLDGLKVLLDDEKSNLGWRIVTREMMEESDFKTLLERTESPDAPSISIIIPAEFKKMTKAMLTLLRRVRDGKPIDRDDISLLEKMGAEPLKLGLEALGNELNIGGRRTTNPGLRKLAIKVTTVQGAKGLDADVVFITHFDDQYFVNKAGMCDMDVCKFLVALTRAKKKVFLMSSQKQTQTFLKWINKERIANN